ncbi:acetyl-CoA hydrolase/transferase family protein [Tenacibaculum maritimum]|uniref:Putative 4-hydroxybutyrate coenzyme A transferase n=1 Tax=Tenacibaculum maritimum NCIMB 2154 TaxID=1349785 RepID=A0A2H1EA74_9FLAO|nr:acetyl-CoA hydrolase/transferase C-terminal domain-containing protein [Tenacibaculum maritimum]MCD9562691.1 acetyl-CoA hydrolase/transferase family protein [Tenacibaculum maritimum]MCD9564753.1 acetyl-CoA hydrolase/transferase family protein [Tenacibaculum maritimum]MCD9577882.1 acetyl-CoA hydrolase/transferase family protein [Tenacibaculum maritimum]MCD9596766.1 acetyl-CoA hydrolase/transferase family protein [Tenacibaculum maritimum]MCD9612404.1 acetyl-CoA hydrolase/transferase family pro
MNLDSLKIVTAEEAVSIVKPNNKVFFQGAAMTPNLLIDNLCERYSELNNVEIIQIHTHGKTKYLEAPYSNAFKLVSCFVGDNVRKGVNTNNGDYVPIFLSEIHWLFRRNIYPLDVAFIQVSPPDKHGYCSLGVSVDITLPAIQTAKKVIAQINPNVPRTHGDGIIHISKIDYAVEVNTPIYTSGLGVPSDIETKIGKHVAELIEDGATLQMGIGNIPNAVLHNLTNHKRLGIHTEMFSDGVLPLIEKGIITGEEKEIKTGKIVTCFAVGSQKLYDFIDDNPLVHFKEAGYTNDTSIIKLNPKVTAINSAIEIDITGQVCADTIGKYQYSGVGGQMDFVRGASLSKGGKAIIAMPSITAKGISKITPFLKEGAGVTTTRAHVHYVATEYGVVNLFGKSLKQRAKALISIAHPNFREELEKETAKRFS